MKIYAWRTILGTEGVSTARSSPSGIIHPPLTGLLYSPRRSC